MERSFGGNLILQELRKAGAKVEPHSKWFRHDTKDEQWLAEVGKKKWIVLMRDKAIGHRLLELEALLYAGVKAFVLIQGGLPDSENAKIIVGALQRMLRMAAENNFPFIARIGRTSSVTLWKTKAKVKEAQRRRSRKR